MSSLAVKGNNSAKSLCDLDNRSADLIKNRQIMLQATKLADEKIVLQKVIVNIPIQIC